MKNTKSHYNRFHQYRVISFLILLDKCNLHRSAFHIMVQSAASAAYIVNPES